MLKQWLSAISRVLKVCICRQDVRRVSHRAAICGLCMRTDSQNSRLYRYNKALQSPTCGIPFFDLPERDNLKDGCGCTLALKWLGPAEHCPCGEW